MPRVRWRAAAQVCAFGFLLMGSACSSGSEPSYGSSSSSIVLLEEQGVLWLASPDDDELVRIDANTLEVLERLPVAGGPVALARSENRLAVALRRASELVLIEDLSRPELVRVPIACGGSSSLAFSADGSLFVSCPSDRRLLRIAGQEVTQRVELEGKPTAVAVADDTVHVSLSELGRIERYAVADGTSLGALEIELEPGFSASQLDALAPVDGVVAAVYQRVDRDSDRERPPEEGGYGDVTDENPRIQPLLAGACSGAYARYDGGAAVFSGPSALAYDSHRRFVWVAHRYTDNVALLACSRSERLELLGSFRVGRGPQGIALSEDGSSAYVDLGFDYAVARLEPDDAVPGEVSRARTTLRRSPGENVFSASAQKGRALFHDATNIHLTPSGVVTCATCHPNGGDDGLTWFLHTETVARKLRRTPPAWAGRSDAAPYHWNAEFSSARSLTEDTIVGLMDGDALLIDLDAVADYLDEIPIPRLYLDESDQGLVATGEALFESPELGCRACHSGSLFTDGLLHEVVRESDDPDARLVPVQTPSLRAVAARPPFLHDGRAATLRSVLEEHNDADSHGGTSELSAAELDALLAYLRSL